MLVLHVFFINRKEIARYLVDYCICFLSYPCCPEDICCVSFVVFSYSICSIHNLKILVGLTSNKCVDLRSEYDGQIGGSEKRECYKFLQKKRLNEIE